MIIRFHKSVAGVIAVQWVQRSLPCHLDNGLCVIDEVEEVQRSDQERLQEIEKSLGESLDIDFMSLCPAPGEKFPKFEWINNFP